MIKTTGTGDDSLLRCEPSIRSDTIGHHFCRLDIRRLHVDRSDAKLFIAELTLIIVCHIVLDQIRIGLNLADEISLVPARVEITMSYLSVVVRADRIISLTDMHQDW